MPDEPEAPAPDVPIDRPMAPAADRSGDRSINAALAFPILGQTTVTAKDLAPAIALLPLFRQRWLFLAAAVALVLIFAVMNGGRPAGLAPFVVFTALFQGFMFLGPRYLARRSIATMSSQVVRYRLDPDEIAISNAGTTVARRWDVLERFVETDGALLIWVGPSAIQIVAKRAFAPHDLAWLRERLATTVGRGAAGRKARGPALRMGLLWAALVVAFLVIWQLMQASQR